MPICIAGMHRSGTSMISRLLKDTGVFLGEESDFLPAQKGENLDGFWEHFGFYALNEQLLKHLGAGWDMPDLPEGWEVRNDLEPFRESALKLIERMNMSSMGKAAWGWKDPRNAITIQFWKTLLPEIRTVICVRNPLEVAASLQRRNNLSLAASERLWLRYYRNLVDNAPKQSRSITLYEDYFRDPAAELKRLLWKLGLSVDEKVAIAACGSVNPAFHHNHASIDQLTASGCGPEIIALYASLRSEAKLTGQIPEGSEAATPTSFSFPAKVDGSDLVRSRFHVETAQREEHIRHLIQENTTLRQTLCRMEAQVNALVDEITTERAARELQAHEVSAMAERAIAVHGLIVQKHAQFAFLQGNVELTLKDEKPFVPRFICHSNSINSLYRIFKRVRNMGKLFKLQRELNDAVGESLGTLTHIAAVKAGRRDGSDISFLGLEWCTIEKTRMNVPQLMTSLRIRLS